MAQETKEVHSLSPDPMVKITLPGDEEVKLSVLLMAGHFVKDALYAPTIYRNEAQAQEITGLTALSRDVDDAANRRNLSKKRLHKRLDDVPEEHRLLPQKSSLILPLILILGTFSFGMVAWTQYNIALRDQIVGFFVLNQAAIAVFSFFIAAFFVAVFILRRRKKRTVSE